MVIAAVSPVPGHRPAGRHAWELITPPALSTM